MFRLLAEGKLRPYLRRTLDPGSVLLFLHIPKTAGTSLTGDLARLLPPYMNLAPDYADTSRPFREREDEMLARFLARARSGGLRSASGHYTLRRIRNLLREAGGPPGFTPAYVSMLREPVTRLVSDYAYLTSPAHPDHAAAKERYPTLEAFVEAPREQNWIAQFLLDGRLLAGSAEAEAEIPAFLDRTYRFLGTVEEYEMSSFLLFALAGLRHVSTARANVAPGGPTRLDGLDPALLARIRELNRLDQIIYRHVSGVLARIRPAYEELRASESRKAADSAAR
ncbi:MAG: hypothetical protein ACK4PG_05905 [Acetobacteraceae bacterium]